MEQYKETLKKQNIFLIVCNIILALFALLSIAAEAGLIAIAPMTGDSHWQSKWRGFVCGAAFGIMGLMIFGLLQNRKALRNDKQLKQLYIKNHDERTIQIWTAARAASMQVFLLGGLVACVVAGYFSITVSLTILVCVVLHALTAMGFKMYYSRKY